MAKSTKTKKAELTKKVSRSVNLAAAALLVIGLLSLWLPQRVLASCGGASPVHMYLLWDPTSGYTFPSAQGWQLTSTYNGRFIRGAPVSEFGQTGGDGTRPFSPSVNVTVGTPNQAGTTNAGNNPQQASTTHTHPAPTYTLHSDDNGDPSNPDVPAFRTLQLMEYNPSSGATCIPTTIPAGAIALFNSTTLPTGFTQYAPQNSKTVRVNSTVTTGGGDTITNQVTNISGLSADTSGSATFGRFNLFPNTDTSNPDHTHGPPSPNNFTTTPVSALPPYVQPIMAQATINIPTLSINITAFFDGDPGAAWTIVSNNGGLYYHNFIRPGTTVNLTAQGSLTHTDPSVTVVSGPATPVGSSTVNLGFGNLAVANHTHNITFDFGSVSNVPPYVNFVIAQKVSFTLNHYWWYVESGGANVNDPWPNGSLDITQDTAIPAIPAAYKPPSAQFGTQLRLRVQVLVSGQNLAPGATSFQLQYQETPSTDCLSGSWTNLSDPGAVWQYGTNSLSDGTALPTPGVFGPGSPSTVMEVFSKSDTGATTPNGANTGQTIEYDWLIKDANAKSGTDYHFRVIETNGTPFGSYINPNNFSAECPGVVTAPGIEQQLRHGEFFLTNPDESTSQDPDQGFSWVE